MPLSSRKEKILQAIVDDYITSAMPISSTEIHDKHLPALSSATIRNELAALEEMGYLYQPHTSSGRIPTAEAYRMYVDKLMPKKKLSRAELKIIKNYFSTQVHELKDILTKTAKVLTEITNLTSVAFTGDIKKAIISSIKIVKLSQLEALVIIVTDRGVLKDTAIKMEEEYEDTFFSRASEFLSESLSGHSINAITSNDKIIRETVKEYKVFFKTVIKILKSYAEEEILSEIFVEGSSKILQQPEYSNLNKARAMLEILDAKEQLIPMLKTNDDLSLNIKINNDDEISKGVPECAIITANYSIGGKSIGNAGVIGPIRMDYPKVISVLDYIGKTINMLPGPKSDIEGIESSEREEVAE